MKIRLEQAGQAWMDIFRMAAEANQSASVYRFTQNAKMPEPDRSDRASVQVELQVRLRNRPRRIFRGDRQGRLKGGNLHGTRLLQQKYKNEYKNGPIVAYDSCWRLPGASIARRPTLQTCRLLRSPDTPAGTDTNIFAQMMIENIDSC